MDVRTDQPLEKNMTNHQRTRQPSVSEVRFLAGPQSRLRELGAAFRVFREMISGIRQLHFIGPSVTVFGSARFKETHEYYKLARSVGEHLALAGFTVMTGGGPGIMEAANRGAKDVGGRSVGCNIVLPMEQDPNPYLDTFVEFDHFFVRKVMLAKYSYAFVALPGGFGTADEVFEIATLIQTRKIKDFPIVLAGSAFWNPLLKYLRETMVREGTISDEDVDRFYVSDSPEEIACIISEVAKRQFGLQRGVWKPRWWMFERSPWS